MKHRVFDSGPAAYMEGRGVKRAPRRDQTICTPGKSGDFGQWVEKSGTKSDGNKNVNTSFGRGSKKSGLESDHFSIKTIIPSKTCFFL